MVSESFPKWKVTDARSLLWERWNNEYAVFHTPSGKTHFLNVSSALILQFLSRAESDVRRVADEIGLRTGTPVDDAFIRQIRQALLHFEQLGLVTRVLGPASVVP